MSTTIADNCVCGAEFSWTGADSYAAESHFIWLNKHLDCKRSDAPAAGAPGTNSNEDYLRGYREGYHAAKMEEGR